MILGLWLLMVAPDASDRSVTSRATPQATFLSMSACDDAARSLNFVGASNGAYHFCQPLNGGSDD